MKNRDKFLISTIIGGAVGTVIGFLLAPDAGKKTRKKIVNKGKELKETISDEYGEEIEEMTSGVKEKAKDLVKSVKKFF